MSKVVEDVHEVLNELARHKRLVKALRDRSNWTKDGKWSPLMGSLDKDIFRAIDQILEGKTSEDQPKLSL